MDERSDLGTDEKDFAVAHVGIAVAKVGTASTDCFDFPALQFQAYFMAFNQMVFMTCTFVQSDGFGVVVLFALFLGCLLFMRLLSPNRVLVNESVRLSRLMLCLLFAAALWSATAQVVCLILSMILLLILAVLVGVIRRSYLSMMNIV